MAITALTNSTSPETVERATADGDPYSRETQLNALAHNFDDHDHTSAKGLPVGRVQTSSAPAQSGQVRVNSDSFQWWGSSAAAVRTAADLESAQTVSGVKTFSAAPVLSAGLSTGAANVYVNVTSNANMTTGVTINQGAADDEALALKSSDVAHGVTTRAETDTYGSFTKASQTNGGLKVEGLSEALPGLYLIGTHTTDDTTKALTSTAPIQALALKKSGTGTATQGANSNLFCIQDGGGSTQWIVDLEGDTHRNGTDNTYDAWDDAQLVRAFALETSPQTAVRQEFDRFLKYRRDDLIRAGILHASGFYNESALLRLCTGAIWQMHQKFEALSARVTPLLEAR